MTQAATALSDDLPVPGIPGRDPELGMSLGQDAWRRLKKNRIAMASLLTLIVVGLLAAITPILPLQPPDRDQTALQYAPPAWNGLGQSTFEFDWEKVAAVAEQLELLGDDASRTAVADVVQRPYRTSGFGDLNALDRWMVRMRAQIFGRWEITSLCGRDLLGRDLLSRVFWGARISLVVGLVATLVSLLIGVSWGAVAGYAGGFLDNLMMRIVDVLYSIPFIFVVIFILTILGEDSNKAWMEEHGFDRIAVFYLVVGAIYWLTMARVVRGQVLSLKNELFVEAARGLGAGHARIILHHLLPNLFSIVIVYLTLTIPRVMLFEAFLSFLGLGVEPPEVSWGLLANEGIQVINPLRIYWWLILYPSLALGVTLFSLNFLGDGLRDALDPKMRNN